MKNKKFKLLIIFAPLQGAKLNLIINYHARTDDLERSFL